MLFISSNKEFKEEDVPGPVEISRGDRPEKFSRSILDALMSNVAVLDNKGWIINVNQSWINFALKNGVASLDKVGVGVNYFEVCRTTRGDSSDEAPVALDGLLSVLNGNISYFELEYPCNSPDEKRWFLMRATCFTSDDRRYLVVNHINITRRKQAEDDLRESYNELEGLIRSIQPDNIDNICKESIIEQRRLEEALRESENKFRNLMERAPFAVYIYRGEEVCCYVNPAAEALTGYTKEEFLRMSYWAIAHPDFRELVRMRGIKRQRGETVPSRYRIKILTKEGKERWVELNASSIMFEGKPAILVTAINITEQIRAEEAMAEARNQAEVYVDLMSHDINNMTQVALGNLELFLDILQSNKKIDDNDQKLLQNTSTSLKNISRLIDNVRKIQMVRSGELKPQLIDIGQMIAELITIYESIPGREVVIRYKPVSGHIVQACELFKDVVINILDNAVKHSSGPLLISIGIEEVQMEGNAYYKITIEDNGPGIPDNRKQKIFERHKRGDTKAHGRGLGLFLVKTLVEDFNGKVWVEDRVPGDHTKGSKFVILMPAIEK